MSAWEHYGRERHLRAVDDEPPHWMDDLPPYDELRTSEPSPISATKYVWRNPTEIPQRDWIYGRMLQRGTVIAVIAAPAMAKTTLMTGTALALVTGKALLGKQVWKGPQRVWLWNLEDPISEIAMQVQAAAIRWNLTPEDIGDRLYIDSAIDGAVLTLATETRDGFQLNRPAIDALTAELMARQIDVLVLDPWVSAHQVNENDNGSIDAIAKALVQVASTAKCCIVIVHHARKLGGTEATEESARGAGSLVAAARSTLVLNRMSEDEAKRFNIDPEVRRRYFRTYDPKGNRAPPAEASDWHHLASVQLGNGPDGGDSIGVVEPWTPTETFDGLSGETVYQVQRLIDNGEWRKSEQSSQWAGKAVAEVLGLDPAIRCDRIRISSLLREWTKNGALVEEKRKDSNGDMRPFITVGTWAIDAVSVPVSSAVRNGAEVRKSGSRTTPYPPLRGGGGAVRTGEPDQQVRNLLSEDDR